jgi:hypothetical protein
VALVEEGTATLMEEGMATLVEQGTGRSWSRGRRRSLRRRRRCRRRWGEMDLRAIDPCWSRPRCGARGGFSGRGEPGRDEKLILSFATGQG